MLYPHRDDYKCPTCKTGTKKWRGELFASTYVLGMSWCDNPNCPESKEHFTNLFHPKINKGIDK